MKITLISILASIIFLAGPVVGQTQTDTIFNYKSEIPVTIDGQATEVCWANATWHNIDQVWIPWGTKMKEGDFSGRFKVSWDSLYLYVLVEVVDDSLSDDHTNPLDNFWEDDCLEVFIDENRSKGDHERNNNAFAYHVSLFYDAIDLNSYGSGINYKNNLSVDMDTIGNHTYLWEFAIKNYSATFTPSDPEKSRVYLSANKKMGFTIAYCDNDETTGRENFIGSMVMTQSHYNDMYKNADYFGLMILKDADVTTNISTENVQTKIKIYPIPATSQITIETGLGVNSIKQVSISNLAGQVVKNLSFTEATYSVNIEDLDAGVYILRMHDGKNTTSQIVVKQP